MPTAAKAGGALGEQSSAVHYDQSINLHTTVADLKGFKQTLNEEHNSRFYGARSSLPEVTLT